ncbi:sugar transferase [Bacillus sp. FJAT-42376]|nr:sugar transferase [Bacillus sp. FJAT-42376]
MDITGSLIGLIVAIPIFIVIILFYQLKENKGPIFFSQNRIGRNGKKFKIYKFRSMVVDAEEKLKSNLTLYEKYIRNNYKLEPNEDPRITKLGLFLRKTSLDEIPQLLNVLKGEMSLVGPRPVVEEELQEYQEQTSLFLSVKPGVTGYWQTCGRSNVSYPERVNIELYYVFNKSIKLDVVILIKTVFVVVLRRGAY